jgi:hypothetical protein
MIDMKQLSGVMNTDDSNDVLPATHHKHAMNMRFRGNGNSMRGEGIPGTRQITHNLPAGNNECIGSFEDMLRRRIIWFNYNSEGRHGIYQYDIQTATVSRLLVCFTDSADDILNFDLDYPIPSVVILYTTEDDGDILHWTDRLNRPRKLNLKDALDRLYGSAWLTDYLTIARPVAPAPPTYSYQNDATVNINNLRKKLFQFRYRYGYHDLTKSTWSAWSKLFAPPNPDDVADEIDQQKNNRLDININTGAGDAIKIEIAGRHTVSGIEGYTDPFLIATLDKSDLSLIDYQVYTHEFLNNESYPEIDLPESLLLWSYVPQLANTIELLNGNVIIYGATTEGYDFDETLDVDITLTLITYNPADTGTAILITNTVESIFQNDLGNWVYNAYFTVTGNPVAGDIYTIVMSSGGLIPSSFSYTALLGDDFNDVITGLINAFNALIQTTPGQYSATNNLGRIQIFSVPVDGAAFRVQFDSIVYQYAGGNTNPADGVSNSIYKHRSRYGIGLVYFDEFDETDGVHINAEMLFETPEVTTTGQTATQIPKISIAINHQPPIWAKRYSFVRTANKTVAAIVSTVSCDTKKDTQFGYINITNQQTNTSNYPAYGFSEGDRVRILGEYSATPTILAYDFPIISLIADPTINGVNETGVFLKIPYNAVLTNFGTTKNYDIEIYTPAPSVSTELSQYYEFGETYNVLNPGQVTRAHQGQLQDQVSGGQPATFEFLRGDYYIKLRQIPFNANLTNVTPVYIIDQSVSDQFPSRVTGNGRAYVVDPAAINTFYMTRSRWSEKYQQNTNINKTNIVFPLNLDEIDRAKGEIQRFLVEDRLLYVYQNRGVGNYGVYAKYIQNNAGQSELVTTNDIITAGNINYLQGEYGVGTEYTGLIRGSSNRHYFADPVRGYLMRRSGDGMTPISELYWGQYYIRSLIVPYNKTWTRANGSRAKILGCYDYIEEQYLPILQAGTLSGENISNYTFSFNEKRNGFASFYDINNPDWMMSSENKMYAWKNGQLYVFDNEEKWCYIFGVQYYPSITLVFNKDVQIKKTFQGLAYQGNRVWIAPTNGDIVTSQPNPQTGLPQISQLKVNDFEIMEGLRYAAFLYDANSMADAREALVNGDYLKGTNIEIKLTYYGSDFANLYLPYIKADVSPRNL